MGRDGRHGTSVDASDHDLLARVRSGDAAAYGLLWERHQPDARTFARHLVGSPHEADDVVAEAFARVLRAIRGGAGPTESFRPYLMTAVRRTWWRRNDHRRTQPFGDDLDERGVDPRLLAVDDDLAVAEDEGVACRALRELPARWQTVLWMTAVEDRTSAEVGAALGLSANAAAALIGRAREGLRRAYLRAQLQPALSEACRHTQDRLAAHVRRGLGVRDAERVEAHLDRCVDCRERRLLVIEENASLDGRPKRPVVTAAA